ADLPVLGRAHQLQAGHDGRAHGRRAADRVVPRVHGVRPRRTRLMRRWALGALSVWPLLFLPVAAAVGGAGSPAWLKALTLATILLSMSLVVFFAHHAYRNPEVSEDGKVFW